MTMKTLVKEVKKDFFIKLEDSVRDACRIDNGLFEKYEVKRGLRNNDRTGVLVGLTNIGDVVGYEKENGRVIAIPGRLMYRGIDIEDITHGFRKRAGMDSMKLFFFFLQANCRGKMSLKSFPLILLH